jgi:hypothetical protein
MRVYVLHLDGPSALARAFDHVLESQDTASCMIEPELERIRFLAPADAADALVERIYLEGGLLWCSRHDTIEPATEELDVSPEPAHPV